MPRAEWRSTKLTDTVEISRGSLDQGNISGFVISRRYNDSDERGAATEMDAREGRGSSAGFQKVDNFINRSD
ncbi:Rho GTPase activator Rga [Aspergillus luchuensis]|uniref:Rho GTPase activator Rga n=1 Tax=Aspergillus kawachii TaxID=1069201 RepID=A0A146FQV7_ASPKA|nr:Rho GTPase activator Rga [Aspergillus luchuensis]